MTQTEQEVLLLYNALDSDDSKDNVMKECVYDRLSGLLVVQADYFDHVLIQVESSMNLLETTDLSRLKQFNQIFSSLFHQMGINRHAILNQLIDIQKSRSVN